MASEVGFGANLALHPALKQVPTCCNIFDVEYRLLNLKIQDRGGKPTADEIKELNKLIQKLPEDRRHEYIEGGQPKIFYISDDDAIRLYAFKGTQYMKRGTVATTGTGVGIATYRALKLLEGPALRQIKKKQAADTKKMNNTPKKLKTLPAHRNINDLRRQLYKKRGFKPIWFIKPNGEARGITQIQKAYSIYS
jgi:hypothetical protein